MTIDPRTKATAKALQILTGAPLRTCQQVAAGDLDADHLYMTGTVDGETLEMGDLYATLAAYSRVGRAAHGSHVAVILAAMLPEPFTVAVAGTTGQGVTVGYPWAETAFGKRTVTGDESDWSTVEVTHTVRTGSADPGDTRTETVPTGLTADCDDPLWVAKAIARTLLGTGARQPRWTADSMYVANGPADTVPDRAVRVLADTFDTWDRGGVEQVLRWITDGAPTGEWVDPDGDGEDPVFPWLLDTLVAADPSGSDGLMDGMEDHEVAVLYDRTRGDRDAARDIIIAAASLGGPLRTQHPYVVNVADGNRPEFFLTVTAGASTLDRAVALGRTLIADTGCPFVTIDSATITGRSDRGRPEGTQTHVVTLLPTRGGILRFDHTVA